MTDQEIKQKAENCVFTENSFRKEHKNLILTPSEEKIAKDFYIGGAHTMLPEVDELKLENKYLKESLCTRKAENEDMEYLWRRDKELLNNAVSLLKGIYEDDDYFCTMLLDIDEEAKICEKYCCDNINEKCILRYLKHYKKETNEQ